MYYENKNTNESKSEEKEKKSEEEEKIESFIKNNYKKLDFWVEFKKQEALFKKFLKNFNVKYGLGTKQYLIALIFLSMSFAMFFSWLDPFDKNAVNFEVSL